MANYDKYSAIAQGLGNIGEGLLGYLKYKADKQDEGLLRANKTAEEDAIRKATTGKIVQRDATGKVIDVIDDPVSKQKELDDQIRKAAIDGKIVTKDPSGTGLIFGGYDPKYIDAQKQIYGARAEAGTSPTEKTIKDLTVQKLTREAANPGTEGEKKAAGFGARLQQAETVFDQLTKEGYDRTDLKEEAKARAGLLVPASKKKGLGKQQQAENNFINATLRRESGAAISPHERTSAEQQYFPRPGDTPEVIEQKRLNRLQVIENLKTESGPAQVKQIVPQPPPGVPKPGDVVDGYVFKGGDPSNPASWSKK